MSRLITVEGIKKTIFGQGAVNQIGDACKGLRASKVLLVMDRELSKTDIRLRAEESLKGHRLEYVPYLDITPEPSPDLADRGADLARKEKVGCVVGVGGGSTMDVAKAIAVLVKNDGRATD